MGRFRPGAASGELGCLFRDGVATGLSDKELLDRFAASRDPGGELAFMTLIARHGPMVLNVCRRILRDPSDAEDAFQATFLVLVRKAGSIRIGNTLAPWLYGVSVRVARRVRVVGARRRPIALGEGGLDAIPDRTSEVEAGLELRLAIDDALARLPASFREAIVLCHLEGLTHEEAAEKIGCPVGTVRSRLSRGRALLKGQLERSWLGPRDADARTDGEASPPLVIAHLTEITARAAARLAAGQPMAGIVPARLIAIVAGVTRSMMISKLAASTLLLAGTALAAWGVSAGLASPQVPEPGPEPAPAASPTGPPRGIAVAQVPSARAKPEKALREVRKSETDLKLLAELPAVVLDVEPKLGAIDVDPGLREIRVTFSKPMMDQSWSWVSGQQYGTPESDGKIHYEKDRRTCVMPVKLEPGKTYVLGINSERFRNFQDVDGRPAIPYFVAFRTRATH